MLLRLLILQSLAIGFMEAKTRKLYADDYVKPYLVLKSIKHSHPAYEVEENDLEDKLYKEDSIYKLDRHNLLDKVYGLERAEEVGKIYRKDRDNVLDELQIVDRGKLKEITDILESESQPVSIEDCYRNQNRNKNRRCIRIQRKILKSGNKREKLDSNVAKGIYKIITTLDQINNNIATMVALNKNQTVKPQTTTKKARRKREVSHTTEAETTKKTTETNPNTTVEASVSNNNNTQEDSVLEKTNETLHINGRRSYILSTPDVKQTAVKNKLLSYLDATYNEIVNKIAPIQKLKQEFSDNDAYKIGYLNANVDTLAVNINKLKQDIDDNKDFWDDEKILELFDKLTESNKIVTDLIDSLNGYVERSASKPKDPQRITFI